VLSLALPFPMIAVVLFTRRAGIIGRFANGGLTHIAAVAGTILVLSLNALIVLQTFDVAVRGLPGAG
jgi:manganese transport protein